MLDCPTCSEEMMMSEHRRKCTVNLFVPDVDVKIHAWLVPRGHLCVIIYNEYSRLNALLSIVVSQFNLFANYRNTIRVDELSMYLSFFL